MQCCSSIVPSDMAIRLIARILGFRCSLVAGNFNFKGQHQASLSRCLHMLCMSLN